MNTLVRNTTDYSLSTGTSFFQGGVFCGMCNSKTYLAKDGSHRRCPNCDDGGF